MDVRQLRAFVAVARELSFRRGAETLYVSPATVSETVRSLERELGGPLLVRTSRRVELSEAGRHFYAEASQILARIDLLRAITRESLGSTRTSVTVGEPSAAHDNILSAITEAVERATSRVVMPVELNTTRGLQALQSGEVDLAVLLTPLLPAAPQTVVTAVAATETVGLLIPPGHRLHRTDRLGPDDLAGEEVLLFPRLSAPGYWDYLAKALELHHPGALIRDTLSTRAIARAAARRNLVLATEARRERVATAGVTWRPLADGTIRKTTVLAARLGDPRPWVAAALRAAEQATTSDPRPDGSGSGEEPLDSIAAG